MKKTFYFLLFLCFHLLFLEPVVCARNYLVNSSGVYVGARGSRLEWQDQDKKFFGYLIGPSVGIDYRKPSHVYGGYRFYWMYGKIKSGDDSKKLRDFDTQGRLGYTYGKTFLFTPYTGIGVNIATKLRHDHQVACHQHSYKAVYIPIGVLMTYHPSSTLSFGFDYQYAPQIDSYCALNGFKKIAFELKNKRQHSVEIPIQFCYPKPRFSSMQFRIIPFYRTYAYGTSKVVCSCDCLDNRVNLSEQRVHEWGVRYEVAIW